MAIALTDSARVREAYAARVGQWISIGVAVHLLLFYFSPPFEFKPYEMAVTDGPPIELYPDEFELPPAPREVPAPPVAIEPAEEGEPVDDIEIPPNVLPRGGPTPTEPPHKVSPPPDFVAFDEPPVLLGTVRGSYPELARQAGIEGSVLLKVLVDTDGSVLSVSVLKSNVTPAMEKAAMAAAVKLRFRPAKQGPQSVRAYVAVPISFELH